MESEVSEPSLPGPGGRVGLGPISWFLFRVLGPQLQGTSASPRRVSGQSRARAGRLTGVRWLVWLGNCTVLCADCCLN